MKNKNVILSPSLVLILLASWWVFWLTYSSLIQDIFIKPRPIIVFYFSAFIVSFLCGGAFYLMLRAYMGKGVYQYEENELSEIWNYRNLFKVLIFLALLYLLFYMFGEGAFSMGYADYFDLKRGASSLDIDNPVGFSTKVLVYLFFPYSFYVLVMSFSFNDRVMTFLSVSYMLMFSYAYQVNYPVIYLFVAYFIFVVLEGFTFKRFFVAALVGMVIVIAAINRYGSLSFSGILNYYLVNYHTVGFTLFDFFLEDTNSPIHERGFGFMSMGFISQSASILMSKLGIHEPLGFYGATSQYISTPVVVGVDGVRESNAFGTLLFTFYRDFYVFGFFIPSFLYGFLLVRSYCLSYLSNIHKALFILLGMTWIIGFMISPIERPYFWFVIILILLSSKRFVFIKK